MQLSERRNIEELHFKIKMKINHSPTNKFNMFRINLLHYHRIPTKKLKKYPINLSSFYPSGTAYKIYNGCKEELERVGM